jgi:hypothetical protein
MNCVNHPATPATAYCQHCGKALCAECTRTVNNLVSCESCAAGRVNPASGPAGFPTQPWGQEPWLAFVLGLIPGVGAMYNGQFAKGLAHVVIFAILVDLSNWNDALGILVAAWVFYQAFEAYQTASARRDGLPLPNPLGLNDIDHWFRTRNQAPRPENTAGNTAANPYATHPPDTPAAGFTNPYAPPPMPPTPPLPPGKAMCDSWRHHTGIPAGAIVLVVLGVLFLLSNFGMLSFRWINHGWPLLLIALGLWMIVRHKDLPPAGGAR